LALSPESVTAVDEANIGRSSHTAPTLLAATDPATIGKSLQINGEVIGSESMYIDGKVEGTLNLPDSRVTVGRHAQMFANITAQEVAVLGTVRGNVNASARVDIHRRFVDRGCDYGAYHYW
jgi:cytoskeletal protein CcmA (bactofilin family)